MALNSIIANTFSDVYGHLTVKSDQFLAYLTHKTRYKLRISAKKNRKISMKLQQ